MTSVQPLFSGCDWNFPLIQRIYDACHEVGCKEFGLSIYPAQLEIISSEQMLDAYSSIGMPLFYKHWSFGKHFSINEALYRKGMQGLAYEIVINSDPCIAYLMEENTAMMQTLVIAHAAIGHNSFFKNNYMFKDWTDAAGIIDYLDYAKKYIAQCEEKYGETSVERIMDSAHALMSHAVHRSPQRRSRNLRTEEKRAWERKEHEEKIFNDLWRTLPRKSVTAEAVPSLDRRRELLQLPQENILYFLEKKAPRLSGWQRELLRIVRLVAQYFQPQALTKLSNEGCATTVHYRIMNRLYDKGLLTEGAMLEFLKSHTSVVSQPGFDSPYYSGINPYALGFALMQDIGRMCLDPTDEDKEFCPEICGNGDEMGTLRHVWANYRDDSLILQFLSPNLIRDFGFFHITDNSTEPMLKVSSIHNERGYRDIRQSLSRMYTASSMSPDIQVMDVDLAGDRKLILHHNCLNKVLLEEKDLVLVMQHLANLWGYNVLLKEIDPITGNLLKEHQATPPEGLFQD